MVNFTREPIIESVITPREGCKLVVRNSKGVGQEEYFVDAVEVVSFGPAVFYRSLERPKNFLLPVSDYEVLEVRETRMVLKHKLEPEKKGKREPEEEAPAPKERRRERRRGKRRGRREVSEEEVPLSLAEEAPSRKEEKATEAEPPLGEPPRREPPRREPPRREPPEEAFASMPPPPSALISETIGRYKEMLASAEEEEPELVPPAMEEEGPAEAHVEAPKGAGLFSPASFLRKLTGREEGEE